MLDELSAEEKNLWEREAGNMILVPLQGKRHFLGGIAGLNKQDGSTFDKNDLHLLQLFASIVSVAIENAMAVKSMEASHELNEDYRFKLENLNKQLIESSKELEYLSLYDSVTALPNRSLFHDRLARDISEAKRNDTEVGVLFIDIDSFTDINDTLGHDYCDRLLKVIAQRLKKYLRESDTVARLGGDEFVVLINELDEVNNASNTREKLKLALEDPIHVGSNKHKITASIGVSIYPLHGKTADELIASADEKMYVMKNLQNDKVGASV